MESGQTSLRQRTARRDPMLGSFIKLSDPAAVEIFGAAGFDFVVIDQEHGPFDRTTMNVALLAARAAMIPALVRVPQMASDAIQAALDGGAAGILAPHITSAEDARALVASCRYRGGRRGYSGVTRAGGYGSRPLWQHIDGSDAAIAVVAMIEDPLALDRLDEILSVEGLDAVFIGRGDLTVALEAPSRDDEIVVQAVDRVISAALRNGKPVWMLADGASDALPLLERGVAALIVSSDQGILRKGAVEIAAKLHQGVKSRGSR